MRPLRYIGILLAVSVLAAVCIAAEDSEAAEGSEASAGTKWTDPNYRDPPKADVIINVTDDLAFKSNDPAYTIAWTLTDTSGSDSDRTAIFANSIGLAKSGFFRDAYTYTSEECLPSWITWDATASGAETGRFTITIRPALQQVSEDTHGDYWIWFSIVDKNNVRGRADTTTYLVKFDVDVKWAGGVVVPESYSLFVLKLDYGLPNGANNITLRQQLSADATEYRFPISSYSAVREGYTFKGWSLSSGSSTTDIGEEFPLNVSSASTRTSTDDDGNKVHTVTIFAVWEKDPEPDPSPLPNYLGELLAILSDPGVLGLFVLFVFGFACIARVRRQGMM